MAMICVFGDSITYGVCDFEKGGWVNRLRSFLDMKTSSNPEVYFDVYNLGVSGDTTTGLLERFEIECKSRVLESIESGEQVTIIFSIGINDSLYLHDEKHLRTSPEEFKANIQKLVKLARKFTDKIVFLGLTPVDETKTTPILWHTNKSYKNEYVQRFDGIAKSVCKEENIPLIEIFDSWIKLDYKKLLGDGLHPNSDGHKKIFETVKEFLIRNKII